MKYYHGRQQQICACSKCIRNVLIMLSFAYKFALSANPLPYLELPSEFVMNVKTITKFWVYVNNKSFLSTKPLDLISYHILSFAFKFGWLTIAMIFFEFVNEFAVIPNSSENYNITNRLRMYLQHV